VDSGARENAGGIQKSSDGPIGNTGPVGAGKRTMSESGAEGGERANANATSPGGGEAGRAHDWVMDDSLMSAFGLGESGAEIHDAAANGVRGPAQALPHQETIQRSFGAHDVSGIQAHVGGEAAKASEAIGAEAYATGSSVAFRETPSLFTAAHEAAHVVQQRSGVQLLGGVGGANDAYEQNADAVAERVVAGRSAADLLPGASGPSAGGGGASGIQMRRVPTNTGNMLTTPGNRSRTGANYAANSAGTRRVIELAEAEMTDDERARVRTAMLRGQTQAQFNARSEHEQLIRHAEAIRTVLPELSLGDPALIDTGPRPRTQDATRLLALVNAATTVFDTIIGGSRDADLAQIFGAANVAAAKTKYANGKQWMRTLHTRNRIVTDRSGYNDEVGLGGLTGYQTQISLSPQFIDAPGDNESVLTMVHEAMHAGNDDVGDQGYIGTQVFPQLPEAVKLGNAAHFEVVPRRILGADHAYAGQTFTPAGASSGGVTAPPLTATQTAVRDASEQIRMAWTMGLNLHTFYGNLYKDQRQWATPQGGGSFRDGLPYWSKVEKLTIHQKTDIDPASTDPARRPISQIDMAISEGVTRRFATCMSEIGAVPNDDAQAATNLATTATPAEITAAATPAAQRDLWIKVALQRTGSITGTVARDLRVVQELVMLMNNFGTILDRRDLSAFPD
jgi:Domain of unknown function (DUF4157)